MKALHAGLLVAGAALAGGLAVRLAEPPPITVTQASAPPLAPKTTSPAPPPPPAATAIARWRPAESPVTSAPAPVYTEPPPPPPLAHLARTKPSPLPQAAPPVAARVNAAPETTPKPIPYAEPPAPAPDPARHVTIEPGAGVAIRTAQPLSAGQVSVGGIFNGVLAEPLIADGLIIGERGAKVSGRVITISGQFLTLRLLNFQTADGQRIEISTEPVTIMSGNVLRFRLAARVNITERRM